MLILFLIPPASAAAQEASVAVESGGGRLAATVIFNLTPTAQRLEPIEAGLKSRMLFILQVMERRDGFFSFLGDMTVGELTVDYLAYRDFLEDTYILEEAGGGKRTFHSTKEFFRAFSRLERVSLDTVAPRGPYDRYYLRVLVRYFPVKLVAPLTLIYMLSPRDVIESGWRIISLTERQAGE